MAAFAASAILFIGSSAVVAHIGDRAVRAGVGAAACAAAAAILLIPLASTSAASVVTFVLARGPVAAVLYTVTFPLGALGGRGGGRDLLRARGGELARERADGDPRGGQPIGHEPGAAQRVLPPGVRRHQHRPLSH